MAIVQLRRDTEGRAYYRRKLAAGKTPMEAFRALTRRLSDVVYKQIVADARRLETGPGDTWGDSDIQRGRPELKRPGFGGGSNVDTSERSHFPDPLNHSLEATLVTDS